MDEKYIVIIPTFNEQKNIVTLITDILKVVPDMAVLVVDDNSPDGTAKEVEQFLKTSYTNVNLMVRKNERGLGSAYRAGLKYGLERGYQVLITMDADYSHNPVHLPSLLSGIKDHDVVIGSRYIRDGGTINWRIRRILLSWLANRFARFLLGMTGRDLTSGYRAYRWEILEAIGLDNVLSNGYSYLVEMLFRAKKKNARILEVPIIFYDRTLGKSKISRKEIYRGAFTVLRLRLFPKSVGKKKDAKK